MAKFKKCSIKTYGNITTSDTSQDLRKLNEKYLDLKLEREVEKFRKWIRDKTSNCMCPIVIEVLTIFKERGSLSPEAYKILTGGK